MECIMSWCFGKKSLGWMLLIAVVCLSLTGKAQAQKGLKVAVVDLQAVLDSSTKGKAAKDRLKNLGVKLQEENKSKRKFKEDRERELQKLREDIRSKGLVLNPQAQEEQEEAFRKKVRELKRFIDDTNNFIEDATAEFREREVRETRKLLREIRDVVQAMGKEGNYHLVLEGNASAAVVLYFDNSADLTEKVVARYNKTK
jgi:Skp family chaperone for outer membrane proteins